MLRSESLPDHLFHGITVRIRVAERNDGAWVYSYGLIEKNKDLGGGIGVDLDASTLDEAGIMVRQHAEDHIGRMLTKRWIESTVQSTRPDMGQK
jgi:hypothetical protein